MAKRPSANPSNLFSKFQFGATRFKSGRIVDSSGISTNGASGQLASAAGSQATARQHEAVSQDAPDGSSDGGIPAEATARLPTTGSHRGKQGSNPGSLHQPRAPKLAAGTAPGTPATCAPASALAARGNSRHGRAASKRAEAGGTGAAASAAASAAAATFPPCASAAPAGVAEKLGDAPLRLVIVGHNPSETAWRTGHFYANRSNWMWRILRETGLAPESCVRGAQDDGRMPQEAGVGFTDVGLGRPGTDSSAFSSADFAAWRSGFYARLTAHVRRASDSIGCTCGRCGAPSLVAFSGKRQFMELLNLGQPPARRAKRLDHGPQERLPEGWPLPASTHVWVCPSTSGAAPMTRDQRYGPYQELAAAVAAIPWPRQPVLACGGSGGDSAPGRNGSAPGGGNTIIPPTTGMR